jgi:predicted metal-binding membrane protein
MTTCKPVESASLSRRRLPLAGGINLALILALLLFAAGAWALTDDRMGGMDAGPGTDLGTLGFFLTAWVVMMAAMMFPSIAPMVVLQARMQQGRRERGEAVPAGTTPLFIAGYLVTWAGAGLVGYAIIDLAQSLSIDVFAWDRGGPYLAGGVIVLAAVYQLTPLKDACLRKCRSPLMFLLTAWRPGRAGAFRMGLEHGGWCVGCCWALMAALFALGVMSIGWMAFIAALIAIEKLLPWKALANRGIAVLLLVLGLAVAFAPEDVPGLTLPDSPEAARAMESMGMEPGGEAGGMSDDESMGGGAMEDKGMGGGAMEDQGMGEASSGAGMDAEEMP